MPPRSKKQNPLLSKRVNFPSVGDIVDEYASAFRHHFKLSDQDGEFLRNALFTMFTSFMGQASYALALGATKGIDEALELMKDPEYHEVVKKRRRAELDRMKERRGESANQQAEYVRRRENPTRDEKVTDIRRAIDEMAWERKRYHQAKTLIQKYIDQEGNQVVVDAIKRSTNLPDDLWFETFNVDSWVKALAAADVSVPLPEKPDDADRKDDFGDFFDKNSEFE